MRKITTIAIAALCILSCGPGKGKKAAPQPERTFPEVTIPAMIQEPAERMAYAAVHYWDAFAKGDFPTDSLRIGGIGKDEVERQMGIFASILAQAPELSGKAMAAFVTAFSANPPLLGPMTSLADKYFYDPNSPLRNEEAWMALASRLSECPLVDANDRGRYAWQARLCALNRPGTLAADFTFTDLSGRRRTLHSIKAEYLMLIFGNPDCTACRELVELMSSSPEISALEASGRLKVVDIFIDREVDVWKSRASSYPKNWINGYDQNFVIREDLIYNVRAVPSIYLLDSSKRVLLKDAPTDTVLSLLASVR